MTSLCGRLVLIQRCVGCDEETAMNRKAITTIAIIVIEAALEVFKLMEKMQYITRKENH
jgi:hypothetical protein